MSRCTVEIAGTAQAESELDAYVANHSAGTVYHRVAWRSIFGAGLRYRSWPLLAKDAQGRITGALTLYLVPSPSGKRLVAVPFRDRGGPIYDGVEALDPLLHATSDLAAKHNARAILLKSLEPFPETTAQRHGLRRDDHWIRSYLPLAGMTSEALWGSVGAKTRNMIRQAKRHGLVCRESACDEAAVRRWHELHLTTQHRLGIPAFPQVFFSAMFATLSRLGAIALLEVLRDEHTVAATILLLQAGTCIYGYSCSTPEGQRLRANDLMLYKAISFAIARGCTVFDLGSDSPAQESLLFFKRKWGATQQPVPLYASAQRNPVHDSSERRYALARSVVRRLPLWTFELFVTRLTRFLG